MRIGEVAQIVGISARSIRHYHRLGVMPEPERTSGGYRDYDLADLARIARIAFLSDSGVPLREVGAILESERSAGGGGGAGESGGSGAGESGGSGAGESGGSADTAHRGPAPTDPAADLAAIRDGIDRKIAQLTRQRERLDVIARRAAAGLPPGLLPEPVATALNTCRADAAHDPELTALIDREHDLLDLVALGADFPDVLTATYVAIGSDAERRRDYLDMLAGFQRIEGHRPADVEPEIARLVDLLLRDPDLRALVAGPPAAEAEPTTPAPPGASPPEAAEPTADPAEPTRPAAKTGPTLDQLLPDPAQREVVRRTLIALDVLP